MKYHILHQHTKNLCDRVCHRISEQTISKEKLLVRLKEIINCLESEIKSDKEWEARRKSEEYRNFISERSVVSSKKAPRVLHGFVGHGLGYDHINSSDMDDWVGY